MVTKKKSLYLLRGSSSPFSVCFVMIVCHILFLVRTYQICSLAFGKYAGAAPHKGCISLYRHLKASISLSVAPLVLPFSSYLGFYSSVRPGGIVSELTMLFNKWNEWREVKESFT